MEGGKKGEVERDREEGRKEVVRGKGEKGGREGGE